MKNENVNWAEVERLFPVGSIVNCKAKFHVNFGVFADIGHPVVMGLVEVTEFLDEAYVQPEYPPIGSYFPAVVFDYRPENNEIKLIAKPSVIEKAKSTTG